MAESFLTRMLREAREREAKQQQTSPERPEKPQKPDTPIIPIQPVNTSTEAETASQGQIQLDNGKWDKDEFRNAANVAFAFHNRNVITGNIGSMNWNDWYGYFANCRFDLEETARQNNYQTGSVGLDLLCSAQRSLELRYRELAGEAYDAYLDTLDEYLEFKAAATADADQPDEPEAIAN